METFQLTLNRYSVITRTSFEIYFLINNCDLKYEVVNIKINR